MKLLESEVSTDLEIQGLDLKNINNDKPMLKMNTTCTHACMCASNSVESTGAHCDNLTWIKLQNAQNCLSLLVSIMRSPAKGKPRVRRHRS